MKALLLGLGLLGAVAISSAAPFTPGNILVSSGSGAPIPNTVFEYTRTGAFVQSVSVPELPGQGMWDYNRGMVVDRKGRLHIFNGSQIVGLSSYDPVANTWIHTPIMGLDVGGSAAYGKIACFKDYVFMVDHGSDTNPMGIVRINVNTRVWTRFASPSHYNDGFIDLNVAPDGLLYALSGQGSPSGRKIEVYNPTTLAHVRTIDLAAIAWSQGGGSVQDLSVRNDGRIYLSQLYSPAYLVGINGNLLTTYVVTQTSYINDFDVAGDGPMIQINSDGHIYLYDPVFSLIREFQTTNYYASDSLGCFVPDVKRLAVTAANPATGVPITVWTTDVYGDKDGTTAFERTYKTGTLTTVTAPTNVGGQYFDHWEKDAQNVGTNRTISVAMDGDHTVRAVFLKAFNLTISSQNPTSGVPIKVWTPDEFGRTNGSTLFGRTYTQGTVAKFTAPQTVGENYFMRWDLDGSPWLATPTVSLSVSASRTLTAVYGTGQVLTVSSTEPSVPIQVWTRDKLGQTNGTTVFTRLYATNTSVSMTAPATANGKAFIRWEKDGTPVAGSSKTVAITMDGYHTLFAVYGP